MTARININASAVSDAPRSEWQVDWELRGRVRYSCLKEAAGEGAFMQIQSCRSDEKDLGNRWWSEPERRRGWVDCRFGAKVRSEGVWLGAQGGRPPARGGKARGGGI